MSNQIEDTLPPAPAPEGQEEHGRDAADYLSFRPGQRLRKARELRGMTIEQVARELALTPRYVEAMESDSYKDLPEPAFVRGYMRRYAQLVKLSPDDIAAKFDQCYADDKETPALEVRPRNPIQLLGEVARRPRLKTGRLLRWSALLFILVLLGGLFWTGFASRSSVPVADDPAATAPVAPAVPAPVEPAPTVPAPVAPAVPDSAAPVVPAPAPATGVPAPATTAPTPAPAVPVAPAPSTAPGLNVLPTPAAPPTLPPPGGALRSVPVPAPTLQPPAPAPAPQTAPAPARR
ncbi:MAG TPA: helix-turn-helix domain-containing protein [Moraxellaceae bacterium]|nr:helix-turn-helix domain-containing protein [Moraxellaceae bacterium]